MNIEIAWVEPIQLTSRRKLILAVDTIPETVPEAAGVYFFSRKHGDDYKPFYIGETLRLRSRLREHLKSVPIVDVLRGHYAGDARIKQGARFWHCGIFRAKSNQDAKRCIRIVQKSMLRTAIKAGVPILNTQLTTVRTHTIAFTGSRKWFDPETIIEV